jgi:hypothetical protein
LGPQNKNNFTLKYENRLSNLNGCMMVFQKHVLLANKFDDTHYFDPKYHFGGNETEWFNRFIKIGGEPRVVPRTFIYHYKIARWRDTIKLNNVCIYTINTGGYEGDKIYLPNKLLDIDCLYFTDTWNQVYKCIKQNIIPFYIDTKDKESKLIQRTIKTSPHLYLPYIYDTSIYIDGNIQFINKSSSINKLISYLNMPFNIVCFDHWGRDTLEDEAVAIIKSRLELQENINKMKELYNKYNFNDDIGLTETNVLIRKHKNIIEFSEYWTECINICRRDQLSFDFLLYKYNINYKKFTFQHKILLFKRHEHTNPSNRRI